MKPIAFFSGIMAGLIALCSGIWVASDFLTGLIFRAVGGNSGGIFIAILALISVCCACVIAYILEEWLHF